MVTVWLRSYPQGRVVCVGAYGACVLAIAIHTYAPTQTYPQAVDKPVDKSVIELLVLGLVLVLDLD